MQRGEFSRLARGTLGRSVPQGQIGWITREQRVLRKRCGPECRAPAGLKPGVNERPAEAGRLNRAIAAMPLSIRATKSHIWVDVLVAATNFVQKSVAATNYLRCCMRVNAKSRCDKQLCHAPSQAHFWLDVSGTEPNFVQKLGAAPK